MSAAGGGERRRRPSAKQSLGQNFLVDDSMSRGMVGALEAVGDGERLVELGPGQGALTSLLLQAYPQMLAVELDQRMEAVLREDLPQLSLRRGDMLELDLADLSAERGGALQLITNTPFYLTSPFLFKLLGQLEHVEQVVLSMQAEVADKVLAPPRCKDYGILTVMLQLFGRPERLFEIPAAAFRPVPKCSASVLRLRPTAVPLGAEGGSPLTVAQRSQVLGLLKLAFEQRRKMLRHTLKPLLPGAATPPPDEMLRLRPEQLPPAEWVELAAMLFGGDETDSAPALQAAHASGSWKTYKRGWRPPVTAPPGGAVSAL
jgi:16S rRNA (adenine1518-N6/adenine1519-N6)-dimethyltransferase